MRLPDRGLKPGPPAGNPGEDGYDEESSARNGLHHQAGPDAGAIRSKDAAPCGRLLLSEGSPCLHRRERPPQGRPCPGGGPGALRRFRQPVAVRLRAEACISRSGHRSLAGSHGRAPVWYP